MRVRALDQNGDWVFGIGANAYLQKQAALKQLIQTRVLSFINDCFFDTGAGIDWFNLLNTGTQLQLQLAVAAVILNTPDQDGNQLVTGLQQLSVVLNPITRNLNIQYQAISVYSVITGAFSYDINGQS